MSATASAMGKALMHSTDRARAATVSQAISCKVTPCSERRSL